MNKRYGQVYEQKLQKSKSANFDIEVEDEDKMSDLQQIEEGDGDNAGEYHNYLELPQNERGSLVRDVKAVLLKNQKIVQFLHKIERFVRKTLSHD